MFKCVFCGEIYVDDWMFEFNIGLMGLILAEYVYEFEVWINFYVWIVCMDIFEVIEDFEEEIEDCFGFIFEVLGNFLCFMGMR